MTLQLAYITNLDTKDDKKRKVEVQFNPTDLTFSKGAQFAEIAIPGLDAPVLQFVRGGTETLTLDLFFDTTDDGMGDDAKSVNDKVDLFYNLIKQDPDSHAPPRCRFVWGEPPARNGLSAVASGTGQGAPADGNQKKDPASNAPYWFTCIIEAVDRKFLLFSPKGVPLRARVTIKMREYQTIEQMVARLKSADQTKAHILQRNERLDQISAREYETPLEWRRIAEENDIDDPRRLAPGTILHLPPIRPGSITRRQGG